MAEPSVDTVYPLVYQELRRLATALRPGDSLTPTTLVHEAYLRMVQLDPDGDWSEIRVRAVASRAMRSVLIDRARRRNAEKRGGDRERVTLAGLGAGPDIDLLALNEALDALEAQDPESYRVVELRFFGGFSNPEVAEVTGLSLRSVERRWRAARALLRHLLDAG